MTKALNLSFLLLFLLISCDIKKPQPQEYDAFVCEEFPEDRLYFPEEKLVFKFNMPVNPYSLAKGFVITPEDKEDQVESEVFEDTISILPPLPSESKIKVTLNSALKSIDNKPLMTLGEFSENKEALELYYEIGKKLPELSEVLPSDSKSATIAAKFDGYVEINLKDVEPQPLNMMKIDEWYLFIYNKPLDSVKILSAKSLEREGDLKDIEIVLPDKEPKDSEVTISHSVTDTTLFVTVQGDSVIAVNIEDSFYICYKGCKVTFDQLSPETEYSININSYTTNGKKSKTISFVTKEAEPHIMISEVMHTPTLEPQKNWEFVEIYNYSDLDFDLSECFVDDKNDGKGVDPLILKDQEGSLVLEPKQVAVITGNEALFSDLPANALWLIVDDTTVADSGLTSNESVQILCNRNSLQVLEAFADPSLLNTASGYSFNADTKGNVCQSEKENGTPGIYVECK